MTVVNKYSPQEASSLHWHSVHPTNDAVGKLCVSTLLSFQDIFKEDSTLGSGGSRISRRGGPGPIRGGVDLRRGCFLAKMYAKTKEFGPIGGRAPCTPPRSANVRHSKIRLRSDVTQNCLQHRMYLLLKQIGLNVNVHINMYLAQWQNS